MIGAPCVGLEFKEILCSLPVNVSFTGLAYIYCSSLSTEIDRIDIRKDKGVVKFLYVDNYWEIQLDGQSGAVLQISQRRSDFFEDIHDGSFLDRYFKTNGEPIKLVYTSIMGTSLFLFTVTGFWLWLGPKFIRNKKSRRSTTVWSCRD